MGEWTQPYRTRNRNFEALVNKKPHILFQYYPKCPWCERAQQFRSHTVARLDFPDQAQAQASTIFQKARIVKAARPANAAGKTKERHNLRPRFTPPPQAQFCLSRSLRVVDAFFLGRRLIAMAGVPTAATLDQKLAEP